MGPRLSRRMALGRDDSPRMWRRDARPGTTQVCALPGTEAAQNIRRAGAKIALAMTVLLPFDDGRPHPSVWQAGDLPGAAVFVFHAARCFPFSRCFAGPP